jgi:hypothetical protein
MLNHAFICQVGLKILWQSPVRRHGLYKGGGMADVQLEKPRTPGVIIFAAILNFISAFVFLAAALVALLAAIFGNVLGIYDLMSRSIAQYAPSPNFSYGLVFLCAIFFLLFLAIGSFFAAVGAGLLKAKKFAWYSQVSLSIFGLVGFLSGSAFSLVLPVLPLSAVLNGVLLVFFFRNRVRDYFKV